MRRHGHTHSLTHTHRVQGATECRAVGVRLQERDRPKRRLLLSLFNRWLGRLFEGPFNCRGDGALKTRRLFSPLLLISRLMTPIKRPHSCLYCSVSPSFSPFPSLSLPPRFVFLFSLSPRRVTGGLTYLCPPFPPYQRFFPIQMCPSILKLGLQAQRTQRRWSLEAVTHFVLSHLVNFFPSRFINCVWDETCSNRAEKKGS